MELVKEREESKKKIALSLEVCGLTMVSGTGFLLLAGMWQMPSFVTVLLIVLGLVEIFGGCAVAAVLDISAGTYECRKCGTRFVPGMGSYLMGAHSLTTRYLKCPRCGKKSFCKRRLTH